MVNDLFRNVLTGTLTIQKLMCEATWIPPPEGTIKLMWMSTLSTFYEDRAMATSYATTMTTSYSGTLLPYVLNLMQF